MLTLDSGLSLELKAVLMGKLRSQFANYYNFMSAGSLAESVAFAAATGTERTSEGALGGDETINIGNTGTRNVVHSRLGIVADPNVQRLFSLFLDPSEGAKPALPSMEESSTSSPPTPSGRVKSLQEELLDFYTGGQITNEQKRMIERCVRMHYNRRGQGALDVPNYTIDHAVQADLQQTGMCPVGTDPAGYKVSAFEMIHPMMVPGEKNAELLSVFFNGFPTIELTRAIPFLTVKIYSTRPVEEGGHLHAITLQKYLEGATAVSADSAEDKAIRAMNLANTPATSLFDHTSGSHSLVGMELFRTPQTLVNHDALKHTENYLAPVIDPFRPLASIKSFNVDIKTNVGLIASKTAKLELVLHDRSRMGEFADFINPDRYAGSLFEIEYGWSHPDPVNLESNESQVSNPYAQLLNLTRAKEHFGVMQTSFTFDEVGQVVINLSLYTRGSAEMSEIPIVTGSPALREQIAKMERISRTINELSARVFGTNPAGANGSARQEVRGQQMLAAASDATNNLVLSTELFESLGKLRDAIQRIQTVNRANPEALAAANALSREIEALVGEGPTPESRAAATPPGSTLEPETTAPATPPPRPAARRRAATANTAEIARLRGLRDTARQNQRTTASPENLRLQRVAEQAYNVASGGGHHSSPSRSPGANSVISRITTTVNQEIEATLRGINRNDVSPATPARPYDIDIFLKHMPQAVKQHLMRTGRGATRQDALESDSAAAGQLADITRPAPTTPQGAGDSANASNRPAAQSATTDPTQSVISLGTLIMTFVAKPIADIPHPSIPNKKKFSEVQVYFYNFNNKAGMMSRCNISQFPVWTNFFAREYSRVRLENSSRAVNFMVAEFIGFLANKIVDDPMNPAYNINDLYETGRGTATTPQLARPSTAAHPGTPNTRAHRRTVDEFNAAMHTKMTDRTLGNISGSPDFVVPQIVFEIEALPSAARPGDTILKIHLFDRVCSPHSSIRELLAMSNNNFMSTLSAYPASDAAAEAAANAAAATSAETNHTALEDANSRTGTLRNALHDNWSEIHRSVVDYARHNGVIQLIPGGRADTPQYRFSGGVKHLKAMIQKYVPHIIYGCMGTTIKNASLSSKGDPLMTSVNITRSPHAGAPILANGEQLGGVPLTVYPLDLSMTVLGCPWIRYAQEIFIDFNTNTTADNIYYVTGLTHKFESGTFETTLKFTSNDAYGSYKNMIGQLNNAQSAINSIVGQSTTTAST